MIAPSLFFGYFVDEAESYGFTRLSKGVQWVGIWAILPSPQFFEKKFQKNVPFCRKVCYNTFCTFVHLYTCIFYSGRKRRKMV